MLHLHSYVKSIILKILRGNVPSTILNHFTRNSASFLFPGLFFVTTSSESESDWDATFLDFDFDFDFDSSFTSGANVAYSEATMEYEVTTTCAALSFRGSVLQIRVECHRKVAERTCGTTLAMVLDYT